MAAYDKGVFDTITWSRPHDFAPSPEYFRDLSRVGDIALGRYDDDMIYSDGSLYIIYNV